MDIVYLWARDCASATHSFGWWQRRRRRRRTLTTQFAIAILLLSKQGNYIIDLARDWLISHCKFYVDFDFFFVLGWIECFCVQSTLYSPACGRFQHDSAHFASRTHINAYAIESTFCASLTTNGNVCMSHEFFIASDTSATDLISEHISWVLFFFCFLLFIFWLIYCLSSIAKIDNLCLIR